MYIHTLIAIGTHGHIEMSRWNPKTVEIILWLTCLLPAMVVYSVVISESIATCLPSASFLPAKLSLVCFLAAVMAFSCWGGVVACRWIARRICGYPMKD